MGRSSRGPIAVSGDWHIGGGFDRSKFRGFLAKIKDADVSETIINGDAIDAASCGKYVTRPGTPLLRNEMDEAFKVLTSLREATDAPITFLGGNHSFRITRLLLEKAPGLYGTVKLDELLRLKELDISYKENTGIDNFVQRGNILVGHFLTLRQDAGASAIANMKKYGMGVVTGHGHRLASVSMRLYGRTLYGGESGCLTSLEPEYMSCANWSNGFILLDSGFPIPVPL